MKIYIHRMSINWNFISVKTKNKLKKSIKLTLKKLYGTIIIKIQIMIG